jgi:RNA polymerase sigma factor for flagellar operon FliA
MLLLHLPQVRLVAKSIWDRMRFAVELDDLIGYGMIGLMNAVERFDPSRGILLKTYAEYRIRGAILDGLRGMDWLPRSARQKERQMQEARHSEEVSGVPASSHSQPAPDRGKSRREEHPRHQSTTPYVPRMEAVIQGGNLGDLERLAQACQQRHSAGFGESNPESLYEQKERADKLMAAVLQLPRRHREVIELYYRRELSMKEIGERSHVHESRVSQLHAAAIQRLRKQLGSAFGIAMAICKKPPARYPICPPDRSSSSRSTACQSSSVSTPMVSSAVSAA